MADNFTTLYTGKGMSAPLPSGQPIQQAAERASDFIIAAEKLKYDTYRKNEEEFLKAGNITPEFVLADSARKNTATAIDLYNKKWAKIFQEKASSGGLTTQDKQQMATEKNFIISQNQKDVADMERYRAVKEAVIRNPNQYSEEEFRMAEAEYLNSGQFNLTTPPIKAKDVTGFLKDRSKDWTSETEVGIEEVQGREGRWYDHRVERSDRGDPG